MSICRLPFFQRPSIGLRASALPANPTISSAAMIAALVMALDSARPHPIFLVAQHSAQHAALHLYHLGAELAHRGGAVDVALGDEGAAAIFAAADWLEASQDAGSNQVGGAGLPRLLP